MSFQRRTWIGGPDERDNIGALFREHLYALEKSVAGFQSHDKHAVNITFAEDPHGFPDGFHKLPVWG